MMKFKPAYGACLVVCGAFMMAPAIAATGGQKQVRVATPQSTSANVEYHGVQVAIDPATGRLRQPTAADRAALSRVIQRDRAMQAANVNRQRPQTEAQAIATLRHFRQGQVGALMQVPESNMNYLTVERGADGRLSVHHQGDKPAAKAEEALK